MIEGKTEERTREQRNIEGRIMGKNKESAGCHRPNKRGRKVEKKTVESRKVESRKENMK